MNLSAPELILILVVVLLLFGAKRLPDTARSLGRSMRIFKAETKGLNDDSEPAPVPPPQQITGQPVAQPTYQPPVAQPVYQPPVAQPTYQQSPVQPIQPVPEAERHDH